MTAATRGALASLALPMLLSSLGTNIANVALPTFATVFSASFHDVQCIVLAYLLAITTLIVSAGRLGDIIGRRRLLLIGIGMFTVASALCAAAPTLWTLVAARAMQGVGAAMMMSLTMAFIAETIPKDSTGLAMGMLGAMSAIGTALGPSLGGVLIGSFTWRAIFYVNVPLGVVALLLASRFLPIDRQRTAVARAAFDVPGALLLTLALAAYALAMTIGRGSFGALNIALLAAAAFGIVLLAIAESKATSPLIPVSLFRNPVLSAGFAMSGLVTTVVMATLVVGPFYLSRALGLDVAHIGFVMSSGPIVAAVTSVPAGRIVDRFGAHRVTTAGLLGLAVGCVTAALVPTSVGVIGYIIPLVVITAGYALFQAANNTSVMTAVRQDQTGVVAGMLGLSRNLGLITGVSVMGGVFAHATRVTDIMAAGAEAIATGMRVTFLVAAALIVIALAITHFAHRTVTVAVPAH
jgi:EmrB/QacA subfamily drug resistance transporter